jgi:hypothetical protein
MTASALCARTALGIVASATEMAAVEAKYVIFLIVMAYPAELMPFLF